MNLFPAVDIKDGKCVRLTQGKENEVTVFSSDPVAMAEKWAGLGCSRLHVIDLDGAFKGRPVNVDLVRSICSAISIPVQLGGGIRDIETAAAYFEAGVSRLIIGTMALENPELFEELCRAYPGRVGVSLDARDGSLKTKGLVEDAGKTVDDVVPGVEKAGAAFFIYTDISRDGMQSGVNVPALKHLLDLASVPVLIAGGISTMDDLREVGPLASQGLEGVITGKAIYAGSLDVAEAVAWLAGQDDSKK